MKKILLLSLLLMIGTLCLSNRAEAILINRGTDTLGNRLIYDDDFDITWYDFSNTRDIWDNQVAWADTLVVDFGGTIIDDWRLPTAFNHDGSGPDAGLNVTGSEMGHLYYTELDIDSGGSLNTADNFQHLIPSFYWSGTEMETNTTLAWSSRYHTGAQRKTDKTIEGYALAVRPGDVAAAAVPEPGTIMSLGFGLAGMAFYGVRRRRQRG